MLLLSEKEILKVSIYNMQSVGVVLKHNNKQLTYSSNNTSDFSTLPPPPPHPARTLLPAFIVNYNKDHV